MTNALERLNAALSERYSIERVLGRGGMATIFLAEDLKHGRKVAVKVLNPDLAATIGADRFLREIEIAARLNHPHILPLHDSGEADGFLYYVMPYVEGESLRERLNREKQLAVEDAVRITRDIASALAHAHDFGVIHRDIKPENVLLSGGEAVVADFGIARAVTAAGADRLTETGIAIGTPEYMSPEQASGERELDGRSDIYSLACVLYEMLSGDPPFTGATPMAILARKSLEPVPPLRNVRAAVPIELERAVTKALATVPADRFDTVAKFVAALERPSARPVAARWKVVASVGAGVVLVVASYFLLAQNRSPPGGGPGLDVPRIVVLPFENLGPLEEDYFADGITEEITSRLARLSGLGVIARTSAIQYRQTDKRVSEIGAELNVDYVLEGTIRWDKSGTDGDRVRVSPQLVRVSDETHLWAEPYDAVLADVFSLQADIAERVAQALHVTVLEPERLALRAKLTDNQEAHDAYLRGYQYSRAADLLPTDRRRAIELYERAVELDPEMAEAHALLSVHYSRLSEVVPGEAARALPLAQRHATRALELDPDLAWGHLANVIYLQVRYQDAERALPALELAEKADPNSSEVLEQAAWLYAAGLGDWDRGLDYFRRALELSPLRADNAFGIGVGYFATRRHAEAEPYLDRAIELAPERYDFYMYKAWLYLSWQGSVERASAVLQDAARRLGFERSMAGFVSLHWWSSRLLAADEWYRATLEGTSLGPLDLDSADYYSHKAALATGLADGDRARAYYDSLARVAARRPQDGPVWRVARRHSQLALAYAGTGDEAGAIREGERALELTSGQYGARTFHMLELGLIYAMLGEREAAVEQFERVLSQPSYVTPTLLRIDPGLAHLREVPRFRELLDEN